MDRDWKCFLIWGAGEGAGDFRLRGKDPWGLKDHYFKLSEVDSDLVATEGRPGVVGRSYKEKFGHSINKELLAI